MKIGFLFSGQGAQSAGMGKDLYESYEEVRKVYEKVKESTGIDVAEITFNSSEEELAETNNSQITIYTMCLGILEILKKNEIAAGEVAGLSLGEYTALTYAGCFDIETGAKLVAKRGKIMEANIPEGNWQMAGILALSNEDAEKACKSVAKGFVVPANYNCPGQVVAAGDEEGIAELTEKAKELGAKKVSIFNAKGPFHTEKMAKAADILKVELSKIYIKKPVKKVYKNIDSLEYKPEDNIVEILANHTKSPVHFSEIISNMIADGVDTFVEIGPGRVLTSLVKRVSRDVKLININNKESLEQAILELKGE